MILLMEEILRYLVNLNVLCYLGQKSSARFPPSTVCGFLLERGCLHLSGPYCGCLCWTAEEARCKTRCNESLGLET